MLKSLFLLQPNVYKGYAVRYDPDADQFDLLSDDVLRVPRIEHSIWCAPESVLPCN